MRIIPIVSRGVRLAVLLPVLGTPALRADAPAPAPATPPSAPPAAPAANALPADEAAEGFRALFDGRFTDAWRAWNGTTFPAKGWVVADGCLRCESANGRPNAGGGDLLTKDEFTDFDLRWEWKIAKGGNSGVKYLLGRQQPGKGFVPLYAGDKGGEYFGHEYQMLDDERHPDAKRGPTHMTAAFYDVIPPNADKHVRPAGEFNESRLLVRGNHVEHWLNGKKVVEYELGSDAVVAALAKSKYKALPGFGTKHKSAILLQDHGDQVDFRNVRVRDLSADAAQK